MFNKTMDGSERLAAWREFRQNFPENGTETDVLEAFASVKILPRYLDYYTPDSWPNVFDLVSEGLFCQTGITLVLTSTLHHLGFISSEEVQLDAISNHISGNAGLVLVHNDLCYNFLPGQIVDLSYARENSTTFDSHFIAIDKFTS